MSRQTEKGGHPSLETVPLREDGRGVKEAYGAFLNYLFFIGDSGRQFASGRVGREAYHGSIAPARFPSLLMEIRSLSPGPSVFDTPCAPSPQSENIRGTPEIAHI